MKCDELKAHKADVYIPVYGSIADAEVYLKDKVDEAIDELKQKLHDAEMAKDLAEAAETERKIDYDKLKAENERLKANLFKEKRYAKLFLDERDYAEGQLRATRRALLLMCAKRADAEALVEHRLADLLLKGQTWSAVKHHRRERDKWYGRAVRCRAKAEQYKEDNK